MKITPELTALRTEMPHLFGLIPSAGLPALMAALDHERERSAKRLRALTQLMRSYQASVRWGKDRMPPPLEPVYTFPEPVRPAAPYQPPTPTNDPSAEDPEKLGDAFDKFMDEMAQDTPPQPAPVEAEPDWQEEYEAEQAALLNAYLEEQKNNPEPNPAERDYTPIPESPFEELEAQFSARTALKGMDDTD